MKLLPQIFLINLIVLGCVFAQNIAPTVNASSCGKPEYPTVSKSLKEEGTVQLKFLVGEDGRVIKSAVEKSSGFTRLDEAALQGLTKCTFKPGIVNGVPTQNWASMKYTWGLDVFAPCKGSEVIKWNLCLGTLPTQAGGLSIVEYISGKKNGRGIEYDSAGKVIRAGIFDGENLLTERNLNPKLYPFISQLAANSVIQSANTPVLIRESCEYPEYPSASKRLEEEGTVRLKFLVDTNGKVIDSVVEKSSGFKRLDEATRTAFSSCQFKPAVVDGKPQQSWSNITYTFSLDPPYRPCVGADLSKWNHCLFATTNNNGGVSVLAYLQGKQNGLGIEYDKAGNIVESGVFRDGILIEKRKLDPKKFPSNLKNPDGFLPIVESGLKFEIIPDTYWDEKIVLEKIQEEKLQASKEAQEKQRNLGKEQLQANELLEKERIRFAKMLEEESKAKDLEISRLKAMLENANNQKQPILREMPTRKALVIGNDNYLHTSKLSNARQDANAVGKALSELGFKVTYKYDQNEKDLKIALRQFKNEVNGGDEVVIFYAGHGVQIGSANYLLPIDIKGESEDQVRDDAVQLQRVLDDMSERKAKITLAMIDACRDNPFPKAGRSIGGRGLAPTIAATGQMIIFSAGSGQQALDKLSPSDNNPNGLFTRMLLNEIKVNGVRVDNMIREVRRKVVDAARSVGHEQVPAIYDQVVGDYYFAK